MTYEDFVYLKQKKEMMMHKMGVSENEIKQQIDSYLKDENLELYDLNIVNFPNISKIEVFIYSVDDVNIDITTRLNKQLNRLIEDLGFEKGSFDMIVSSPGIERKLKSFRHFELSVGELIKVKLFNPINNIYTFEGDLISIDEKNICLFFNYYFFSYKLIRR